MTISEQAQQCWAVLVLLASDQKIIPYGKLARITRIAKPGVGPPLGDIAYYCEQKGFPLLNTLAIGQESGKPNAELLEDLDVATEHRRVYAFDWMSLDCPTAEAFDEARAIHNRQAHSAAAV